MLKLSKVLDKICTQLNRNLVNEQKALLISDGSVTSLLEVFVGKTPKIKGVKQYEIKADKKIAKELKIKEGADVIKREVILEVNNTPIIYAISFAQVQKLSKLNLIDDFLKKDKPIGKILKEHKIEHRREITKISLPEDNAFKNFFDNALMREYFVIYKNEPLIKIKEYLNLDYKFNNEI